MLFIDYAKAFDNEKAFDYANRGQIINDVINKESGKNFTKSVAKMYECTKYFPKVSVNEIFH